MNLPECCIASLSDGNCVRFLAKAILGTTRNCHVYSVSIFGQKASDVSVASLSL